MQEAEAVALADRVGELLATIRTAEASLGALLVEIEHRGVMELFGYCSVARLLEHLADIPKVAAERVVTRARALNPGRALDGTPIPALAPATGVAARFGRLSNPMIDVIVGSLADVPPEHRASAEAELLRFAAEAGHRQVAALGARIVAHLDPDGPAPEDADPVTSARELSLRRKRTGVIPAVLGEKSEPLNLGRLRRLISACLRRALFLRDRGCAFPGCHRPLRHCQGHHIRHWAECGPTNLGNLVLMCAHHHRLLHRSGWEVRIAADGLPEFLPPLFLDRRRKPRRNNLHEPLPFAA
ncbi:DUF222 domain-containing protein [Amycolatopsis sp. NPDC004625]|uniref:HNH endonuclease signature motif containing protein n=1 Tax=Amycolatopsis sp. NPDC004625 TaxID=3154670 RepID=UPI00339F9F1E